MDQQKRYELVRDCPACGCRNLSLVGDGYDETYLCMKCHFNAGRFLQNTPESGAVEITRSPITGSDGGPITLPIPQPST